ncbi:MAG: hypothetical protein ACI81T_004390 [Bacteroidia bacterium]|jgi:hypothetical protein
MKDILTELRNVFPEEFHWADISAKKIELLETKDDADCKLVVLRKSNSQATFSVQSDYSPKGVPTDSYIFDKLGIDCTSLRKCDYIIFCATPKKLFVLLVEMKSSKSHGWLEQILQGELIAKHCLEQVESKLSNNLLNDCEFRGILFTTKPLNKLPSPRFKLEQSPSIKWESDSKGIKYVRQPCNSNIPLSLGSYLK